MSYRSECKNHLRQIGLALHSYHEANECFPPAYTIDASGRKLHSWRTLLLPYLDQADLYKKIDFSKPWDDPANAEAAKRCPLVYRCTTARRHSRDLDENVTVYLAVVGEHAFMAPEKTRVISGIADGTSNTVAVVEVPAAQSVHWMSPEDIGPEYFAALTGHKDNHHTGGGHMLMADGAVRFVSENLDAKTRMSLTTVDGGESIGEF